MLMQPNINDSVTKQRAAEQIRVLVADDEELARRLLTDLLEAEADLSVVASAADGDAAIELVKKHRPHLLFLDIKMPGRDGMQVAQAIREQGNPPLIVFVTAFDDYAIPAFDLDVLDYLVKPIQRKRFRRTLERARVAVKARRRRHADESTRHVTVKHGDELIQLAEKDIYWLEAASQYVRIHTASQHYLIAEPLNRYHARLSSEDFVRVHRSAVVNTSRVERVMKKKNGVHELRLANGVGVPLSRSRKELVARFLEISATRSGNHD